MSHHFMYIDTPILFSMCLLLHTLFSFWFKTPSIYICLILCILILSLKVPLLKCSKVSIRSYIMYMDLSISLLFCFEYSYSELYTTHLNYCYIGAFISFDLNTIIWYYSTFNLCLKFQDSGWQTSPKLVSSLRWNFPSHEII